ncbi:MAG: alkaline phosphatase family protein [Bacteroidota bacterium]|nr:alkaline phosphatase family protein [Bacteroidota bacterium]
MSKFLFLLFLAGFLAFPIVDIVAQTTPPKLVVGIVIDQMRYDYISRYWDKYGQDGFKKLVKEGYNCKNTNFNYMPTFTAPGHASIYTGATPSIHGIIANNWYVLKDKRKTYCTDDSSVKTVGSSSDAGKMSPANMLSTTITDELKISNSKSKVIGISLKDRGAILPAGHAADAAYWYDSEIGAWISSSHYMNDLPEWVNQFNNKKLPSQYLANVWNTMLPIEQYKESLADDNPYEEPFKGENKPVFPHDLPEISKIVGFDLLRKTPFGNTFTKDFVIEAIKNEKLGKGLHTDFLAISFSSPDYIGHQFGTKSIEIQDNYLRLDKDIAELLASLDKEVGKGNYLLFLTADHGAAHNPSYLVQNKIPAGNFESAVPLNSLRELFNEKYGKAEWILNYYNEQFMFNRELIAEKGIDLFQMQQLAKQHLITFQGIANVYTSQELSSTSFVHKPASLVQNGFSQKRSGDVAIVLEPGWMEFHKKGTTHGTVYNYDTHVPLIWYGWKILKGENVNPVFITDIAPTLSVILNISMPNGNVGTPIKEVLNSLKK